MTRLSSHDIVSLYQTIKNTGTSRYHYWLVWARCKLTGQPRPFSRAWHVKTIPIVLICRAQDKHLFWHISWLALSCIMNPFICSHGIFKERHWPVHVHRTKLIQEILRQKYPNDSTFQFGQFFYAIEQPRAIHTTGTDKDPTMSYSKLPPRVMSAQ